MCASIERGGLRGGRAHKPPGTWARRVEGGSDPGRAGPRARRGRSRPSVRAAQEPGGRRGSERTKIRMADMPHSKWRSLTCDLSQRLQDRRDRAGAWTADRCGEHPRGSGPRNLPDLWTRRRTLRSGEAHKVLARRHRDLVASCTGSAGLPSQGPPRMPIARRRDEGARTMRQSRPSGRRMRTARSCVAVVADRRCACPG